MTNRVHCLDQFVSLVLIMATKSTRNAIHAHLFFCLACSNILWLMTNHWDGPEGLMINDDCAHLDPWADFLCQMRSLLKLFWRYAVHTWCLLESIHLYSHICLALYDPCYIQHYVRAAYGYPAILGTLMNVQ